MEVQGTFNNFSGNTQDPGSKRGYSTGGLMWWFMNIGLVVQGRRGGAAEGCGQASRGFRCKPG